MRCIIWMLGNLFCLTAQRNIRNPYKQSIKCSLCIWNQINISLGWITLCHMLFRVYHCIPVSCTKHSPSSAVLLRDSFQPFLTEISSVCELRRHCFKHVSWSWDLRLIVSARCVSRYTCVRTPAVLQDARVTAWECGLFNTRSASLLLWVHKESMHWSRPDIGREALHWINV